MVGPDEPISIAILLRADATDAERLRADIEELVTHYQAKVVFVQRSRGKLRIVTDPIPDRGSR